MNTHPPDRRLDRPEPGPDYFREEEMREEWEREQERMRESFEEALAEMRRIVGEAKSQSKADQIETAIRQFSQGRAA